MVPKYARGVSRLTLHFYLKRYKFKMKFRNNNENHLNIEDKLDYSHEEFNSNMIKIIDDVIEERTKKHAEYLLLSKKVWYSNKKNKLTLGKYILGRLLRESDRIFLRLKHWQENIVLDVRINRIPKIIRYQKHFIKLIHSKNSVFQ